MRFCSLQATFGRLERQSLTFSPGLNIIEAPNESGKSTLAAFLRVMLYGLSTRERGALADKVRYLPRTGSAMQGELSLETESLGAITIRRDTLRPNAPMGHFSASYTGTNEPLELTAADCGEALLGVPREVYERSAFIRQSGLTVDQDAELEKRIASLITTLEEDVSYSEATAVLRRQLNARRANSRSGRIPALEREIESLETALSELRELRTQHEDAGQTLRALDEEESAIRDALHAHDLADLQEKHAARGRAAREADEADARAEVLYRMLADAKTPEKESLEQNRAKLAALNELEIRRKAAELARTDAAAALEAFDAQPPDTKPRSALSLIGAILGVIGAMLLRHTLSSPYPLLLLLPAAVLLILFVTQCANARSGAREHIRKRGGLAQALHEAEAAYDTIAAVWESQLALATDGLPSSDAARAAAYIEENLARYALLDQLERDAQEKRLRSELLGSEPIAPVPQVPVQRPARSRSDLEAALEAVAVRRSEAQRLRDTTDGRARAIGDLHDLEAALAEKRSQLETAQSEYDSLSLAMEALEHANTTLANRFSPTLGRRTAELFAELTGGKYSEVLLDRSFHARVAESGDAAYDAVSLSQGASDQLYLAVRLAICELVLPKVVPLVLDDALINFDDARCANALELLLRESGRRQILLLTCQSREADYLRGRSGVSFLTL